jgi:hypothetical protein
MASTRYDRFAHGSGVYTCEDCGRRTRKTAATAGHDGKLCEDCFELAGIYNVHQDGGDLAPYHAEILARCATIEERGGTVRGENAQLRELARPTPRSVVSFLTTEEAREAAERSGHSRIHDFRADSDGRVGRGFSGDYTVEEVRALLGDLERVQAACDRYLGFTCEHDTASRALGV